MNEILNRLIEQVVTPVVVSVVMRFLDKWDGDPAFREKARAAKARLDAAKTEKEHLDASTEIQNLLRG